MTTIKPTQILPSSLCLLLLIWAFPSCNKQQAETPDQGNQQKQTEEEIVEVEEQAEPESVVPAVKPLTVLTTFYPTQYFAQRIAGDLATVICPVPEDADPIFWMPDAGTIQRYQQADLIILNGAGFEKWVEVVTLPQSALIDTAKLLTEPFIKYEHATVHQHGPEGEHTHEGIDGHTWLDPNNAKLQAQAILEALLTKRPTHEAQLRDRYDALANELDELDEALKTLKLPPVLCSHPAYNYLARRYDWKIHNLDLDPEQPLTADAITELRHTLTHFPSQHLLWEGEPLAANIQQLKQECSLQSLTISPCELLPSHP